MRNLSVLAVFLLSFGIGYCSLLRIDQPTFESPEKAVANKPTTNDLAATKAPINYRSDLEPILRSRCFQCHGRTVQEAGLRLDEPKFLLQGGDDGPIFVAGEPDKSRIFQRVQRSDEHRMPPEGEPLSVREQQTLSAWIEQGASLPAHNDAVHWSFRPIIRPNLPVLPADTKSNNPIDQFVYSNLKNHQIDPAPQATAETLCRRLHLDLIGLPPTPETIQRFINDHSPAAYSRLVDELLASPHYGERWARPWLDLARYADSDGFEKDGRRPHAWRYRDWVIAAFNNDLPLDRFAIEQLAGDLLPESDIQQQVATGFHCNAPSNREAGTDPQHSRFEQLVDRVNTFGVSWLGLSLGCAQCHDHKFDPISQREYYQLLAFFEPSEDVLVEAPLAGQPVSPRLGAEYLAKRQAILEKYDEPRLQQGWESELRTIAEQPGQDLVADANLERIQIFVDNAMRILATDPQHRTAAETDLFLQYFIDGGFSTEPAEELERLKFDELKRELAALDQDYPEPVRAWVLRERTDSPQTPIRIRGVFYTPGEIVQAATPACLPAFSANEPANRLGLARWLTSRENPLMPRVAVNRIWQELFGKGLVTTSEDFGRQGELPTHPELLDWLSCELRDGGWSQKRLIRQIVHSSTYRQASSTRVELLNSDPENKWLAKQNRFRLIGDLVRDSALAASGLLNPQIGGQSIFPKQPEWMTDLAHNGNVKWIESPRPACYRRGLYIHAQRTVPYPQLAIFDAPSTSLACSRRQISNTPLQALDLLNDPVFLEAARNLGRDVARSSSKRPAERLAEVSLRTLGRLPDAVEEQNLLRYQQQTKRKFEQDPLSALSLVEDIVPNGEVPEIASWIAVSRVMLNLDEFLTRE